MLWLLWGFHFKPEGGTFADRTVYPKGEIMLLQNGLVMESPTRYRLAGILAGAIVAVEQVRQFLRRDAGAVVLHFHPATAVWHGDGPQHKHTVRTHMVGGVAQQVVQHPFHHGGVSAYHAFLVGFQLQLPAILLAHGVIAARDLKAKLAHVKINGVKLFCTAGNFAQLHHAVYQRAQAVSFVHNNVALFGALGLVIAGNIAHRFGIALIRVSGVRRSWLTLARISFSSWAERLTSCAMWLNSRPSSPAHHADYRHLNIIVAVGNLAGTSESWRIGR